MKGFEVWVAGPWSTLALVWAAMAVGTVLGWGLGRRPRGVSRRERLVLADAAAERAARQFRSLREPYQTSTAAFLVPAGRLAPEVAHEAYLAHEELASEWHDHPPLKWDDEAVPGCPSCERRWEVHVGQALAVANGDPITTGEIRAIAEDMDVWLERTLGQHPVPYPDGGQ